MVKPEVKHDLGKFLRQFTWRKSMTDIKITEENFKINMTHGALEPQ